MTNNNPTCALYARVSTEDQKCALQLDEMHGYCQRRNWTVYAEYVDTGWSGAKKDRPQLNKLMRDAQKHMFDCVIVWKIDRFGRSVAHFCENIQSLDSWGVRFMCISQSVDTDNQNPGSRLLMQILAAVAEFEREMIRERVKAGMAAAKRRGVRLGRHALVVDKVKVLELHLRGKAIRKIAEELKLKRDLVHRIVKAAQAA